jgi:cytochrome c oxidase cbb3-type subunit 3
MTDLPTGFWAGWIVVLTLFSLAFLCWFVFSIYFSKSDAEHKDLVWDSNLREGSNPAPMWWFWLILGSLVFSLIYLMLYPGLGSNRGLLNWSSGSQVVRSEEAYQAEFGEYRRTVNDLQLRTIHSYPKAMASAQGVFDRNCAVCHGYQAQGQADLFPNLVDNAWQWGESPAQIEQSIRGGRGAVMVAWGPILGEQGVANVADYVLALPDGAASDHPGKMQYGQFCSACHAPTGEGNPAVGAPNLIDDIWLYGGSTEAIVESIANGRAGVMPAFGERLDDTQIKLLVALLTVNIDPELLASASAGVTPEVQFAQLCSACHGSAGGGNPGIGAPNLIDDDWTYGGTEADIRKSIAEGRGASMPAFASQMNDEQITSLMQWMTDIEE